MSTAVTQAPQELQEIVSSVFETMLKMSATPALDTTPPRGDMVTAAVYLTGAYLGAVLVHCPVWQACGFAGQFTNKTPPSDVDDDVLDVMGELANMIAGNLKSTVLPGTHLSIPSVSIGEDSAPRLCGGRPIQRQAFQTPLGVFWVTMFTSALRG